MTASPRAHYDANYAHFESDLYAEIRREAYGEDIGQSSWITVGEHDKFLSWLELSPEKRLLDVACGAGGIALRSTEKTGCSIAGVDLHQDAIAAAGSIAMKRGLSPRAEFHVADAGGELPFPPASFDAVLCIDAINHLPDRVRVLSTWARLLKPGGKVLFTDPITVTGPLTNEEISIRSSIGFFLFVPPGYDEAAIKQAGLRTLRVEDVTENMAVIAGRRGEARAKRAAALRQIEGDAAFENQQKFFAVASRIARERRLSRFAFLAEKP